MYLYNITSIGILILILIYIGIADNNLSLKTSATSSTSESDATDVSTDVIFDAKKLIGAKKQDVDVLLNIKGTQDTNQQYMFVIMEIT